MENGPVASYPSSTSKCALVDGSYHEVDSSELSFRMAGSIGMRKALERGDPILLEPIMKIEVLTPEEFFGDIMADINGRRGHVTGIDSRAGLAGRAGARAAGGDLRLRDRAAFALAGAGQPQHGVRPLRGGTVVGRREARRTLAASGAGLTARP